MGCGPSSPDELVPAPLPTTVEGWARLGVPGLLRAHKWLRARAAAAGFEKGIDRKAEPTLAMPDLD